MQVAILGGVMERREAVGILLKDVALAAVEEMLDEIDVPLLAGHVQHRLLVRLQEGAAPAPQQRTGRRSLRGVHAYTHREHTTQHCRRRVPHMSRERKRKAVSDDFVVDEDDAEVRSEEWCRSDVK